MAKSPDELSEGAPMAADESEEVQPAVSGEEDASQGEGSVRWSRDDRQNVEEVEDPFRPAWFFDNPSLGRAIRYTFAEKRLARAVFVNALLMVVMLAVVQELFGRAQLGLFSERISFGRVAFVGLVLVEGVVLSILAPLGAVNLFEAERREECFDQVVASGVSPHRVVFGRWWATLLFLAVVLASSLPFFGTIVVLQGATWGQVGLALWVLAGYAVAISALSLACAVALDDTALPVVLGVLGALLVVVAGVSRRSPPEFTAWSPLRHVVVDSADIALDLQLGSFYGPEPFGVPVACWVLSLGLYAVAGFLGLAYAYVGPDLELTSGLDSFDSVTLSPTMEATRARRGVPRALLRAVQLRFFYENLSEAAKSRAPLLRALATAALFAGAHTVMLSALWPTAAPRSFEEVDGKLVFPYLSFAFFSMGLLALAGAGARSSLLAPLPVRLGPLRVGRFATLFVLFVGALAYPAVLWAGACWASGYGGAVLGSGKVLGLFGLVAGYAGFVFAVSLFMSQVTTNPYSATGWTLILLFATNLLPITWIPLFTGNVVDPGSSWLLDLSPLAAGFSVARPGETFPFTRTEDSEVIRYAHEPSWVPFASFHAVLGVLALIVALGLAYRALQERRAVLATQTTEVSL